MKPKQYRDRLFRVDKPNIRPVEILINEGYGCDMAVMWAAYQQGTFGDPGMDQNEFSEFMLNNISQYSKGWIIEDRNHNFKNGYGPVGIVLAVNNEWEIEPQIEHFKWASPRNRLRSTVSFLQMMRYDKGVGIVNIYARTEAKRFFKHITRYGVLNYAERIPHGYEDGDKYIFWVRGRK